MICGFYDTLFSLVCFVCIVEIFLPRVSSLQSLTLGTRSVFCSSPHNSVSDTGHKSAPLWIILTGYEPCAPETLELPLRPPSCSCMPFLLLLLQFPHSFWLLQPQDLLSRSAIATCPSLSSWPTFLPVPRPLPSLNYAPPTTRPGGAK